VLGRRNKWRTVFFPDCVVSALRAHWADRGHDFEYGLHDLGLLSPVVLPKVETSTQKHVDAAGNLTGNGFSPDGLYNVMTSILLRIADDEAVSLDPAERELLRRAAPHALRHTFATGAVARGLPEDVLGAS
jgi:integrase